MREQFCSFLPEGSAFLQQEGPWAHVQLAECVQEVSPDEQLRARDRRPRGKRPRTVQTCAQRQNLGKQTGRASAPQTGAGQVCPTRGQLDRHSFHPEPQKQQILAPEADDPSRALFPPGFSPSASHHLHVISDHLGQTPAQIRQPSEKPLVKQLA